MLNFVKIGTHKFLNYYIIMVSYKELGLVNTREMFAKAIKGGSVSYTHLRAHET